MNELGAVILTDGDGNTSATWECSVRFGVASVARVVYAGAPATQNGKPITTFYRDSQGVYRPRGGIGTNKTQLRLVLKDEAVKHILDQYNSTG